MGLGVFHFHAHSVKRPFSADSYSGSELLGSLICIVHESSACAARLLYCLREDSMCHLKGCFEQERAVSQLIPFIWEDY